MKLPDARQAYYDHTGKFSDVCRQLSFAGFGIIWVLRTEGAPNLLGLELRALNFAALFFTLALASDYFQYLVASITWHRFYRLKENAGVHDEEEFDAPDDINLPAERCFKSKAAFCLFGYACIIAAVVLNV